jgi:hypothetical protein
MLSFAKYYTQPAVRDTNEGDIDIMYTFKTTVA